MRHTIVFHARIVIACVYCAHPGNWHQKLDWTLLLFIQNKHKHL